MRREDELRSGRSATDGQRSGLDDRYGREGLHNLATPDLAASEGDSSSSASDAEASVIDIDDANECVPFVFSEGREGEHTMEPPEE